MDRINQGLKSYGQNIWMTALMNLTNQPNPIPPTLYLMNTEMTAMNQTLPFFPPKIRELLEQGPLFVNISGEGQIALTPPGPPLNPPLNWERDKILEALREGNMELEGILQTLKVPKNRSHDPRKASPSHIRRGNKRDFNPPYSQKDQKARPKDNSPMSSKKSLLLDQNVTFIQEEKEVRLCNGEGKEDPNGYPGMGHTNHANDELHHLEH